MGDVLRSMIYADDGTDEVGRGRVKRDVGHCLESFGSLVKKEVSKKLSAPGCLLGAVGRSCWWRETEREKEREGRIDIYSA